jgi:hypothetical protein
LFQGINAAVRPIVKKPFIGGVKRSLNDQMIKWSRSWANIAAGSKTKVIFPPKHEFFQCHSRLCISPQDNKIILFGVQNIRQD